MTLIKQAVSNKNKNKGVNKSLSSMSKIKNTELKMNTPSRMLIRNRDNKFIKNDNKVTEKRSEEEEIINREEELLNLVSNKHDEHRGDVLNINETIKSQEKTDRSSNLQSTRVNKKIMTSRIPRRRPVVTANKLTGFHSVTRIVVVKKNSRKIKAPSDPIILVTDNKSDCEPVAGLVEKLNDYKIPESPELSPLTRKISLSSCNNNSYFDDDAGYFDDDTDSDIDNDNCEDDDTDGYDDDDDDDDNSDENSYDPSLHCESCINCACESCINKYKQRAELLHQLKYKHWASNDVLKSARYQSLNSSEEEESSIESSSSPVFEKKIYRKHTREVYTSPKRSNQLQNKNCTYSFLHIVFDIIFWPILFFRKAK